LGALLDMLVAGIMMLWSGIRLVLQDVFYYTPVTSAIIAAIVFLWSKTYLGELDALRYANSFKSCPQRGQWWRLLTSPFLHHNPAQMLLNVLLLWQSRVIEKTEGSLFVLRYTVVLALAEGIFYLGILHVIALGIRSRLRIQQAAASGRGYYRFLGQNDDEDYNDDDEDGEYSQSRQSLADIIAAHPFGNKPKEGFSGISLAWTSYMMITNPLQVFYLFGILPIRAAFAPLAVILAILAVEPTHQSPTQSAGFMSGLLLAAGVLKVLPNFYWSAVFVFDLVLIGLFLHFEAGYIEECRAALEDGGAADRGIEQPGIDSFGLWERRTTVPKSLLALPNDSDYGLAVRFWGVGCAGANDALSSAASEGQSSSLEMRELGRAQQRDEEDGGGGSLLDDDESKEGGESDLLLGQSRSR